MTDQTVLVDTLFRKPGEIFNLPDAEEHSKSYAAAQPYPHFVIEGFFKPDILRRLAQELVAEDVQFNKVFTDDFQKEKTISTGDAVPPLISLVASKFAAPEMLRYLERLTGLKRLVPDPYYNTDYGYYHIVGSGGVLGSHVDHSRHSTLNVPHVLNLVVYLTENWEEKDGGTLCLFDKSGREVVTRIPCRCNRAAIFACTPTAYHGVEPVAADSKRRRHSIYFAYYSVDAVAGETQDLFPSMQSSSNADASVNYGTYFVVPFMKLFRRENWLHLRLRLTYLMNLVLPPIVVIGLRKIAKSLR